MNSNEKVWMALVAVAILSIFSFFHSSVPQGHLGGTTNYDALSLTGPLQIGNSGKRNYIYLGAGDGCSALYSTASSTLVTQATSTSFCN